jgi:hypothetical protein
MLKLIFQLEEKKKKTQKDVEPDSDDDLVIRIRVMSAFSFGEILIFVVLKPSIMSGRTTIIIRIITALSAWPNEPKLCRKHLWKVLYKFAHFVPIG